MDVADSSINRVKMGLRMLQLSLLLPFTLFALGDDIARAGVGLGILVLMVVGKTFCLSARVGKCRWSCACCWTP